MINGNRRNDGKEHLPGMNKESMLKRVPLRTVSCLLPIVLGMLLPACAGQILPGGGPTDTEPPLIIRTFPDSNAVRVQASSVELEFSEYVDRRSVEESIFFSPYVGKLEFDWSGTEVTIRFPDSLRRNTTYVVNVGTDIRDIRAQNRMARGFTLAFTTGDSIDRGEIRGRVFDEHPEGVMIFAYQLANVNPDTLNPVYVRPDYIMQTGTAGEFVLSNIAFGPYRVMAVRDEFRNLVYDREIDQYGVWTGDVSVDAARPVMQGVWFRLAKEDTTKPFVSGASAVDQFHAEVRFSEAIDTLSFQRAVFEVADTLTLAPVRLGAVYQKMGDLALAGIETLDPLDSAATYRLTVRGLADRAGNRLDTLHASQSFPGSSIPDTVRPTVSVRGVADSSRGHRTDMPFEIVFNKPVGLSSAIHGMVMLDSAAHPVLSTLVPRTPAELFLLPAQPLKGLAWYSIRMVLDSVRDSRGRFYRDSVLVVHLQTQDHRTTGAIQGRIVDPTGAGAVVLTVNSVGLNPPSSSVLRLPEPGAFTIERLPEGRYALESYRDQDGNGVFSPGRPYPFTPSERFAVFPDTVKVRARWAIEGVTIQYSGARQNQR
jgi:hypothetical protein